MAKLWATGPVHIFVGISGTAKSPIYLGTGETAPNIDIKIEYSPVMNDIGGDRLPFDRIYEGSEADISVVLTRWNEPTVAALMSVPNAAGVRGRQTPTDLGTLMGSEGYTFPVWLLFPRSPLNAGGLLAQAGMPAGYRFFSCINMGDSMQFGTRANKHHVMVHATRGWNRPGVYNPAIVGSFNNATADTTFTLYDHNMSQINANLLN